MRLFILLLLLVMASPAIAQTNGAQAAVGASEASTDVDTLIRILENDKARQELIERLRGAAPAPEEASTLVITEQTIAHQIAAYARRAVDGAAELVHSTINLGRHIVALLSGNATVNTHRIWADVLNIGLVVFATFAAYFVSRVAFRQLQSTLAARARDRSFAQRIGLSFLSALADLATILLAWAVGYGLASYINGSPQLGIRQAHFLNAFLLIELVKVAVRVLFAPKWPSLRLSPIADMAAAYWHFWVNRLVNIIGYTFLFLAPLVAADVSEAAANALRVFVVSCALAMACVVILQNRYVVRAQLVDLAETSQSETISRFLAHLARLWHVAAIGYLLAIYILWLVEHEAALPFVLESTARSLVAVALGVVLSLAIGRLTVRGMQLPPDLKARLPLLERRVNAFVPNVLRIVRIIIAITVVLAIGQIWRLADFVGWLSSELGQRVAAALVSTLFILLLGALIHLAVQSWVEYRLNPDFGRVPSARERTLLALFRNAFTIALSVLVAMLVLSELGVNIGPLLAGAGIIGLAVGFGSQKLVQDIINGAFIQFENAMNEGDVVTVGDVTGVVERLTIRSVSIRTLDGAYHLIPFSSVDSVANFMRNFSYHVAAIGVDYKENIPEVKKAMHDAFEKLKETEIGQHAIGDLEMHGVTEFGDSAIVVRARIKTMPGQQWALGRAYNEIIKEIFDERGIEIPFPHVTLYLAQDKLKNLPFLREEPGLAPKHNSKGAGESKGAANSRPPRPTPRRRKTKIEQDGPSEEGETTSGTE